MNAKQINIKKYLISLWICILFKNQLWASMSSNVLESVWPFWPLEFTRCFFARLGSAVCPVLWLLLMILVSQNKSSLLLVVKSPCFEICEIWVLFQFTCLLRIWLQASYSASVSSFKNGPSNIRFLFCSDWPTKALNNGRYIKFTLLPSLIDPCLWCCPESSVQVRHTSFYIILKNKKKIIINHLNLTSVLL